MTPAISLNKGVLRSSLMSATMLLSHDQPSVPPTKKKKNRHAYK